MNERETQVKDIVVAGKKDDKRTVLFASHTTSIHKIVRALYYIARNINDEELASSLRKLAIRLSEFSYTFLRAQSKSVRDIVYHEITLMLDEVRLSLQLLFEEEWLTELQRELFQKELIRFESLLQEVLTHTTEEKEYSRLLSPIDLSSLFSHRKEEDDERQKVKKTEVAVTTPSSKKQEKRKEEKQKKREEKIRSVRKDTLKKEERKKAILAHLRKSGARSLPEIADLFEGASQKTIQRDLRELISQGLVEKEGERRWAKYKVVD